MELAEAKSNAGEYEEAAGLFADAYKVLPEKSRVGPIGESVVAFAADAFWQAFSGDGEARHLKDSKAFLERYLADLERLGAKPSAGEYARTKLAEAERFLARSGEDSQPKPQPEAEPEEETKDPPPRARYNRPDPLGVGLTAGGAVMLVGGSILIGLGVNIRVAAADEFENRAPMGVMLSPEEEAEWEEFRDDEFTRGNALLGSGVGVAAVGAGFLVGGILVLVKRGKKRDEELSRGIWGGPMLGQDRVGLSVTGRF